MNAMKAMWYVVNCALTPTEHTCVPVIVGIA